MIFNNKQILGLDVGTSSIKMVQLNNGRKGLELKTLAIENLPSEVVVEGEIMDSNIVVETIRRILKEHRISTKNVAAAVLNRSVIVKKIKMPRMKIEDVEETIYSEAEQYIPFDIEDVNLDFQIIDKNSDDSNETMEVLLVVVKKEKVNDLMNMILESGLNPLIIDVDGFAIRNQYELNNGVEEGRNIALIDIGASIANIIILRNGLSIFSRDISVGGNTYTKAIQKSFNLSFDQAEILKRGKNLAEISRDNIEPIIQEVNENIVNEIQGAFDYFKATYGDETIDRIVLSGGCVCLPGFDNFLQRTLGISVEITNPMKNIYYNEKKFDPDHLGKIAPMLAVTIGLALRRLDDRW